MTTHIRCTAVGPAAYPAEQIHQALGSAASIDRTFCVSLQNDVRSCAERLRPPLVQQLAASDEPDIAQLREILGDWDFPYVLDSVAPTLFEIFMEVWQERVLSEHFPPRLLPLLHTQTGVAARLIEAGDLAWFSGNLREELVGAAARAMQQVRARYGDEPSTWRWGAVHHAHWLHPLSNPQQRDFDIGPRPVDGGNETLRNTGVGLPGLSAISGAEYRLVVDFAQPHQFLAVQNIGNSGQPGDPHSADQFDDWLAGRYHVVSLRRADVERDLAITLEPTRVRREIRSRPPFVRI